MDILLLALAASIAYVVSVLSIGLIAAPKLDEQALIALPRMLADEASI